MERIIEDYSLTEVYRFLRGKFDEKPNGSELNIADVQQYVNVTKKLPKWMGGNRIEVSCDKKYRKTYNILRNEQIFTRFINKNVYSCNYVSLYMYYTYISFSMGNNRGRYRQWDN